jgi:hypothetical protein
MVYPRELFQLQLEFVDFLVREHSLDLDTALFNNTFCYVRIIGHRDDAEPDQNHPVWQKLLAEKPSDKTELADYFYKKYVAAQAERGSSDDTTGQPCFHVYHHADKNFYELHLDANDPQGILAKDRVQARTQELKAIFQKLRNDGVAASTKLFVRSWILNIEAFKRLFPAKFTADAIYWRNGNKSYDNASWGQFLDRNGSFKQDMAEQFRQKLITEKHEQFNLYLPLPTKESAQPLQIFYDHYLNSNPVA